MPTVNQNTNIHYTSTNLSTVKLLIQAESHIVAGSLVVVVSVLAVVVVVVISCMCRSLIHSL